MKCPECKGKGLCTNDWHLTNSDSVEAKTPKQILDDAFRMGVESEKYDWQDYKTLKKGMLKALDKYYASKFIELIDKNSSSWDALDNLRSLKEAVKELWDV